MMAKAAHMLAFVFCVVASWVQIGSMLGDGVADAGAALRFAALVCA
jgi:hypothetical protein